MNYKGKKKSLAFEQVLITTQLFACSQHFRYLTEQRTQQLFLNQKLKVLFKSSKLFSEQQNQ